MGQRDICRPLSSPRLPVLRSILSSALASLGLLLCITTALLASPAAGAESAPDGGPVPVIERLNSTLIAIMQGADALGYKGRYAKVAPVVDETFDLVFMASKSIGRYWKALEQEQRARWVDAFRSYTVSNFADRFDGFSGQTFEILGQKKASHATVLVLTQLVRPTADDVELNYRMRDDEGAWRVVDIYSGGKVSEVALRRSEYASVLKQGGIEKLIAVVNAKAESRSE
jgi:phospholipid transport system substrate-binding protein